MMTNEQRVSFINFINLIMAGDETEPAPETVTVTLEPVPEPEPDTGPWKLGDAYLFRTVTQIVIGRLTYVGEHELGVEDATWVADTGRFGEALRNGGDTLNELEGTGGGGILGRGAIVDAYPWRHDLPDCHASK